MNFFNKLRFFRNPGLSCVVGVLTGVAFENYRQNQTKLFAAVSDNVVPGIPSSPGVLPPYSKLPEVEEIIKHGFDGTRNIRYFKSFVLSYDGRTRNSNWVYEHLTPASLEHNKNVDRSNCEFFEDLAIHTFFRATNEDFKGSGYDRGHLAPAGNNRLSKELIAQTFVLSNISPQVGKGFNRDAWNRLEQYVRYRARKSINTWVCTGPLFLPYKESNGKKYVKYEVIGNNQVAVPTHFFKVLLVETEPNIYDLECYVMENNILDENIPLQSYQVQLDSIERAAGFLIFDKIPRNAFRKVNGMNPYLEKFTKSQRSKSIEK